MESSKQKRPRNERARQQKHDKQNCLLRPHLRSWKPHGDVIRKTELFLSLFFLFFFCFFFSSAPPRSSHSSLMKLWEFRGKRRGWDIARAQSTMGRANFGSSEGEGHGVVSACVCVCPLWWALCACLYSWGCCHTQLIKTSKVNNMKLKPFTDVTSYQITSPCPVPSAC